MTQASHAKPPPTPSLGAAAAAAATTAKPSDKPAETKPATPLATASDAKPEDKPGNGANGAEAESKKKGSSRVYIAVGAVHEFDTVAKAEKFLNAEGAPTEYTVLRGKKISKSTKVSLR